MRKPKVAIAMSGGVDSTACVLLLQKRYDVHGFFMQLAQPDLAEQLERVNKVAKQCNIPLQIIDLSSDFDDRVLNYFENTYRNGHTPNPCMICNCEIKFGLFMDSICEQGIEQIATGHYAHIIEDKGCFLLEQGEDERKDQSYFLARLTQQQLARVMFPLAKMTKAEVYDFVESHGFSDFRGRESQDVCFLGSGSVGSYLESRTVQAAAGGDIVNTDGKLLGHHNGIYNYTIGQRKGLGIAAPAPLYVIRIDAAANRIIVGENDELFQKSIEIEDVIWNCDRAPQADHSYRVRIRYGHKGQEAKITHISENHYQIIFAEKQRAVTPGQFAVIYDQNRVLGSGEIQ